MAPAFNHAGLSLTLIHDFRNCCFAWGVDDGQPRRTKVNGSRLYDAVLKEVVRVLAAERGERLEDNFIHQRLGHVAWNLVLYQAASSGNTGPWFPDEKELDGLRERMVNHVVPTTKGGSDDRKVHHLLRDEAARIERMGEEEIKRHVVVLISGDKDHAQDVKYLFEKDRRGDLRVVLIHRGNASGSLRDLVRRGDRPMDSGSWDQLVEQCSSPRTTPWWGMGSPTARPAGAAGRPAGAAARPVPRSSGDPADDLGRTALYNAAARGNSVEVCRLLAEGAAVDQATNYTGTTPLYVAAESGYVEVANALLARGATVDKAMNDGFTPLYVAAENGYVEVAKALLAGGATVDKAMNDGATPLLIAAQKGHVEVANALLARGATVDKPREFGYTPLYVAVENGHVNVVRLLVENGSANINRKTTGGRTPLDSAVGQNKTDVVDYLRSKGGRRG